MTDDLVAFLRARLDEDADDATAAGDSWYGYKPDEQIAFVSAADSRHIARHDPARVLADIDAKRRIVARVEHHASLMGRDEIHDDLLRLLALPYADHPDYREKWRP